MTIRKNMIFTYLLASVIPLLLSTIIFTLLFRTYWQQNVENILTFELDEFKKKLDAEAEKARFYSYSVANAINTYNANLSSEDFENTQEYRGISINSISRDAVFGGSEGSVKSIEVIFKTNVVRTFFANYYYSKFQFCPKMANYMWEYMKIAGLTRFFKMTFTDAISNILVMRNVSLLVNLDNGEKIGMIISSFPVDRDLLMAYVGVKDYVQIYTKNSNGFVFSDEELNNNEVRSKLNKLKFDDSKSYEVINIKGIGKYYVFSKVGFSKTVRINRRSKPVRINIADIGVLYDAKEMNKQMASFTYSAIILLLVISGIIVFIAILIANKLTRPILNLKRMVSEFGAHIQPIPHPTKIINEISELQKSFSDMSRELHRDLKQASLVQQSILTDKLSYKAIDYWLEIDVRYIPMNGMVSGDYYNIYILNNELVTILLADASGHGTQAALSTMQVDILNREVSAIINPDEKFEYINYKFVNELGSKNFFTAFMLHIEKRKISYSSAAHPAQYLLKKRSKKIIELKPKGDIIGMLDKCTYTMEEQAFAKGDIILLFSDGLTEEFSPSFEEYGDERLVKFLQAELDKGIDGSVASLNVKLLQEIGRFRKGEEVNDDITIITIRKK